MRTAPSHANESRPVLAYAPAEPVWRVHWGRLAGGTAAVVVAVALFLAAWITSGVGIPFVGARTDVSLGAALLILLGFAAVYVPLILIGVSACIDAVEKCHVTRDPAGPEPIDPT